VSPDPITSNAGLSEVLLIEDDTVQAAIFRSLLADEGIDLTVVRTGAEALAALESGAPGAICLDVMLPDTSGEALLLRIRELRPDIPVVMVSAQDSVQRAVDIMKLRPFDYFVKPFDPERMARSIQAALREVGLRRRVTMLEREVQGSFRFDEIVGASQAMRRVYDQIERVLENNISVFIGGESGTGKELVAKAIHYNGARRAGPFVALNCGAIPESLQESELFGHERGAFTGAAALHRGKFEQANRGTLLLDEVGELTAGAQTRLLRVLQESEIQRVGGSQTIRVDVRFITATHRNLEELVAAGRFREDLYYRLVVFPLELPPLRERREDIPLLAGHFLRKHRARVGGAAGAFERDALDTMCRYDWPGNVRELENVVLRALVSCDGATIGIDALPPKLVMRSLGVEAPPPGEVRPDGPADGVVPLAEVERRAIVHALRALDGNVSLVAKRLGLGRSTLYRKLAEFGLDVGS